ncbi:MAG TPA: hypothetical protein H9935_02360, partial [Candidatus Blautia merdigallinarum]|nr:hypothetical protein [Candidatus Blautia merdigallinarum]
MALYVLQGCFMALTVSLTDRLYLPEVFSSRLGSLIFQSIMAGECISTFASDCRQSPRFTPGLFFCSYQHSDYLPSFYQEKIPFINSKIKLPSLLEKTSGKYNRSVRLTVKAMKQP